MSRGPKRMLRLPSCPIALHLRLLGDQCACADTQGPPLIRYGALVGYCAGTTKHAQNRLEKDHTLPWSAQAQPHAG